MADGTPDVTVKLAVLIKFYGSKRSHGTYRTRPQKEFEQGYHMKKIIVALLLCLTLLLNLSANIIKPPKGFHGTLYNSTLILYGTWNDEIHPLCTATVYDTVPGGYLLLSAGHCVMSVPLEVKFSVADNLGQPLVPVTIVKAVRDKSTNLDFSVFELKTKKIYVPIPLAENPIEQIGDKTISVNFSETLAKHVSPGQISSEAMVATKDCAICKGNFMVQLYSSAGASGSAIVSEKTHEIVGLIVGGKDANIGAIIEPITRFIDFSVAADQQDKRRTLKEIEEEN